MSAAHVLDIQTHIHTNIFRFSLKNFVESLGWGVGFKRLVVRGVKEGFKDFKIL
jgi:hypothetical protein